MELYTMNRGFLKQAEIDKFISAIWTERYYGDSEIELVVSPTKEMIQKLPLGTFVGLEGSKEVMILETFDSESGQLKLTGISLLSWLNNRFIRASVPQEDRYWNVTGSPGYILWAIIYYMCISGQFPSGIPNPQRFVIPGLGPGGIDQSGANVNLAIPYGPVYDALRSIATTYELGMKITLESATDTGYSLQFWVYQGADRTSRQTTNPPVRFSPQMDTLTDIKELQSISAYKTIAYSFAPSNPDGLADTISPGASQIAGPQPTGFDLRALMTFEEDISTDTINGDANLLQSILNSRAQLALSNARYIRAVDGSIVPLHQLQYGVDYSMGDIIEVQGNSQVVSYSRVTEYIRSQDASGEKAYPTVAMLG